MELKIRNMNSIVECLKQFCVTSVTSIVIGDFNCDSVNWHLGHATNHIHELFISATLDLGLQQLVLSPTRGDNTLDLLLTCNPASVNECIVSEEFPGSDYLSLKFVLNFAKFTPSGAPDIFVCDWAKADWVSMFNFLSDYNWNNSLNIFTDPDNMWSMFHSIITFAISSFVPLKKVTNHSTHPIYPQYIRKLASSKLSLWHKLKDDLNNQLLHEKYTAACSLYRKCVYDFECKTEHSILEHNNLGSFFRHINSKFSSKSGVPVLNVPGSGNKLLNACDKAQLLNHTFVSHCVVDNGKLPLYSITTDFEPMGDVIFHSSAYPFASQK